MRKVFVGFVGVVFAAAAFAAVAGDEFCDGYEDGYEEGWCYGQYSCLAPLSPLCPLAKLGEEGYRDGYNRGFIEGQRAKARR